MPLLGRVVNAAAHPGATCDYAIALMRVFMESKELANPAIRYSVLLGDIEIARRLLLSANPDNPAFVQAMIKVALLGRADGDESRELAAARLTSHGFIEDAIDVLLMTGHWHVAVKKLIGVNLLTDSAFICRARPRSQEKSALLEAVGLEMLSNGMQSYAMVLFAEAGKLEMVCDQLRKSRKIEQAEFLGRE
jgi:hypothetical protein